MKSQATKVRPRWPLWRFYRGLWLEAERDRREADRALRIELRDLREKVDLLVRFEASKHPKVDAY